MSAATNNVKFISTSSAAERLGITLDQLGRLVKRGALTRRKLPGLRAQILEADVERLAAESVIPATAKQDGDK